MLHSSTVNILIISNSGTCCLQKTWVGGEFGAKRRKTSVHKVFVITTKTIAIIVVAFTNMLFEYIVHLCMVKMMMICILH